MEQWKVHKVISSLCLALLSALWIGLVLWTVANQVILAAAAMAFHHFARLPINRILMLGLVMFGARAGFSSMDSTFAMVIIHVTAESSSIALWHSVPWLSASMMVVTVIRVSVTMMPVRLVPLLPVPFPVLLGNQEVVVVDLSLLFVRGDRFPRR